MRAPWVRPRTTTAYGRTACATIATWTDGVSILGVAALAGPLPAVSTLLTTK